MTYRLSADQITHNREFVTPLLNSSSSSSTDQKVAHVASSSSSSSSSSPTTQSNVSVPADFLRQLMALAQANQSTTTQQSTQQHVLEVPEGTYEGEVNQEGQPHGRGRLIYANSDSKKRRSYDGDFKNGKPHGTGLLTWRNGSTYDGEFADGTKKGQGTLIWRDDEGDRHEYVGQFDHDQANGEGTSTIVWINGKIVEKGEFKDGTFWNGTHSSNTSAGIRTYLVVNGDGGCLTQITAKCCVIQ